MARKHANPGERAKIVRAVKANHNSVVDSTTTEAPGSEITSISLADASREGIRLGFLIHDVSRMRRNAYDQFMKPLGVTRAQWWVLAYLSRHDGMMQTQLADVLEVGKASLGDIVEGLERGGWVQRRPDPTDKRAKRVYLAKAAQAQIKHMTLMEDEFNGQILSALNGAERVEFGRSLQKIKRALSRLNAPAGD